MKDDLKEPLLDDEAYAALMEREMARAGVAFDELAERRLREKIEAQLGAGKAAKRSERPRAAWLGAAAAAALIVIGVFSQQGRGPIESDGQRVKGGGEGVPATLVARSLQDGTETVLEREAQVAQSHEVVFDVRLSRGAFVALLRASPGKTPEVVAKTPRLEAGVERRVFAVDEAGEPWAYVYAVDPGTEPTRFCAVAGETAEKRDEAVRAAAAASAKPLNSLPAEACVSITAANGEPPRHLP